MKSFTMEKTLPINLILFDEIVNQLTVLRYKLTFSLLTDSPSASAKDLLEAHMNQNISFAKVFTFLETVLEHSICITPYHKDYNMIRENAYNNNMLVLPDTNESSILSCLHAKLNSITCPDTHIEKLVLEDLTNNITYTYNKTEDEEFDELPTTEEWVTELSYWDTPWWYRDDALTVDGYAESESDLIAWRKAAEEENLEELNRELFTDIEESVRNAVKQVTDQNSEKGTLVEVDFTAKDKKKTWKPKLV